jgi:hypothetical protein
VSDQNAPSWWVLADAEGQEACVATWLGRGTDFDPADLDTAFADDKVVKSNMARCPGLQPLRPLVDQAPLRRGPGAPWVVRPTKSARLAA